MSDLNEREKKGICGICSAGCWIIATCDEKGRIVDVRPDETSEMGIICTIGEHAPEIIYSEHRLKTPLKRTGEKGTYDFEPISWDEAFTRITEKLNRIKKDHGPEATAIYTGVGSFEVSHCDIYQPKGVATSSASSVLFPFGSPNTMGVGALCYVSYGMIAPHVTTGKMLFEMYNDIDNSELVVVWGANPATDLPPVDMKRILAAHRRGVPVVVIDPRRTATAKMTGADWYPIRPGTDGALALGLCNVLIEEELYDEDFVEHWTVGFDEFSRYAQHFTPAVVEHITGIPAEKVVELARRMARARGVSQYMYTGMEYSSSGVQGIRATIVLWALAGQLDVPGGRCFLMNNNSFPINREGHVENPDTGIRLGRDKFPVYIDYRDEAHAIALPESVLNGDPYKIRSLIIMGGSIITSWPNSQIWRKTLNELDFLVCIDRQLTADCAYADVVLPACTYFEIDSYMTYGSLFRIREKMIEPVGESRSDVFIMAELAQRLGYGRLFPQTTEELYDHVLKGSGFTIDDVREAGGMVSIETEMMQYKKWEKGLLRKDGMPGFDTPSGKFEIASSILEEYGYDPLPVYTEPEEGPRSRPDMLGKYPLVFNSGARVRTGFHTQHRGIRGLVKERPEPTVTLNSADAGERGISTGDLVSIRTLRGAVTMRAYVTDDIVKGAIEANHASGSPVGPKAWSGININDLTDLNQYDPISGFPVYKSLLCDVVKVSARDVDIPITTGEISEDELNVDEQFEPVKEIYLDHNATTPLSSEAADAMMKSMELYGNPSSIHDAGRRARAGVDRARLSVARALNCTARRVVFTGSGSEANNLAIKGTALRHMKTGGHVITSAVEHPAVLNTCRWLENYGFDVTVLPVSSEGLVSCDGLARAIRDDTVLITIMAANNEVGAVQPVAKLAAIAREADIPFHTDAVQAFGKIPLNVEEIGADMVTVSSHKIYGPKGVGALYVGKGIDLESLVSGGGHEWGLRSGTENITGIAGFGRAADSVDALVRDGVRIEGLRDRLEEGLAGIFPGSRVNGPRGERLPNTVSITVPGYRGESVVMAMDKKGIYFSSGSACRAGSPKPSHTLLAMGLTEEEAHCTLRLSLGKEITGEDIDYVKSRFEELVNDSRNIIQFVPCR